jgi:hypothetical protein
MEKIGRFVSGIESEITFGISDSLTDIEQVWIEKKLYTLP